MITQLLSYNKILLKIKQKILKTANIPILNINTQFWFGTSAAKHPSGMGHLLKIKILFDINIIFIQFGIIKHNS